ncbi:hypothetical protein GN958_ATG22547, partial [Phytophthora infestans]
SKGDVSAYVAAILRRTKLSWIQSHYAHTIRSVSSTRIDGGLVTNIDLVLSLLMLIYYSSDDGKTPSRARMLTAPQVIDLQLKEWHEELRKCHALKTIHVAGRYGGTNLLDLPDEMLSDLLQLSLIYLGVHVNFKTIASLTGVPNLQSFTLAWTNQIRELPNFDNISPLKNLVEFVVFRPNPVCCNSFLGPCDLSHEAHSLLGTTPAKCLTDGQSPKRPVVTLFLRIFATQTAFNFLLHLSIKKMC